MVGASLHMAENDFTEERQKLQANRSVESLLQNTSLDEHLHADDVISGIMG